MWSYILDNTENNTFNFVDIKCRCPNLIYKPLYDLAIFWDRVYLKIIPESRRLDIKGFVTG